MVVWFEGVDTTGKSTQINMIINSFPNAILTKEPGGTQLSVSLRELILGQKKPLSSKSELFLFLADRAQHYEEVIYPNKNSLILSDRGFISGISYALANEIEVDLGTLFLLNRLALGGSFEGKIVFFETTTSLIKKRLQEKELDAIELRGVDYLMKVQEKMKSVLKRVELPILHIDASRNIESIAKSIEGFIK